jgi:hypothetical protein
VIEVGVEVFSLGDIHAVWWLEVIASEDVVDVVDTSRSHSDLKEVSRPDTPIGIFSLILTVVRRVHMVVDVSVSLIPFLIVILFEMLMCWVDGEILAYPGGQLDLLIDFVQKDIVFLGDHTVAITAVSTVHLET